MRIDRRVPLLLPPIGVQGLPEIALPVQQTHPDQGHTEIARRLEVVSRKNAKAARVGGQSLADSELGREVRHPFQCVRAAFRLVQPWLLQIPPQSLVDAAEERHERLVLGELVVAVTRHQAQHLNGIVGGTLPGVGVDPSKQLHRPRVPAPAEVRGDRMERGEGLRK